jgi:hypothetical protein
MAGIAWKPISEAESQHGSRKMQAGFYPILGFSTGFETENHPFWHNQRLVDLTGHTLDDIPKCCLYLATLPFSSPNREW